MIVARAPLRISFVGGGTDLPVFAQNHGGAGVSGAINKYVYVCLNARFEEGIRIAYRITEECTTVAEVQHDLVRVAMERADITKRVEIATIGDVPGRGTGLGSSAALLVALLLALYRVRGRRIGEIGLARASFDLERDKLGLPVGAQDHYAAAFGGLNFIEFPPGAYAPRIERIRLSPPKLIELRAHLLLLWTGRSRPSAPILSEMEARAGKDLGVHHNMIQMKRLALELAAELKKGNIQALGAALSENWERKRELSPGITTPEIDAWYANALSAGAAGGKLLGAGGGGFLLFFAPPSAHMRIARATGLRVVPFQMPVRGAEIVFDGRAA